jgi:hypothetical protein
MKYTLLTAIIALIWAPQSTLAANEFVCIPPTPTATNVTLVVTGVGIKDRAVKIAPVNDSSGNLSQYPLSRVNPSNDRAEMYFNDLTPSTAYKGIVTSQVGGAFFEDIVKCTFSTTPTTSTPLPPSTPSTPTSTPTSNDAAFRMSTTQQPGGQVTIYATSLISVNATGWIEVFKSGQSVGLCSNLNFPAGVVGDPCVKPGLAVGGYTARVLSTGSDGRPYNAVTEFSITGSVTSTSTSGTATAGSGTSGTVTAGTTGTTFTPSGGTAGSGMPANNTTLLSVRLENPLKVNTIQDAIKYFVNALIRIAIPFIVVFFIWSGLQFILAQGNPDKLGKAKKTFLYTIIGTLLILGAWTITNAIIGTVNTIVK